MTLLDILMLIGVPSIVALIFELTLNAIKEKYKKDKNTDVALRQGVQALLRNQLIDSYRVHMSNEYITLVDKENYENMYKCYHSLGKNGVMDSCYEEVMNLPVK